MMMKQNIQETLSNLTSFSNQDELLIGILEKYTRIFSIRDAFLYRYSSIGYLAEGVIGISHSKVIHIRSERDDVRSLPVFNSVIRDREAKYFTGIEFLKLMTSKHIFSSDVNSSIIVPLCAGPIVVGFIISYQFDEDTTFDQELLSSLTLFGRLSGNILGNLGESKKIDTLSRRELEVMQHISWGESSSEMADVMGISESTVNQYVKSALTKLDVNNRTQAVAELLRKGVIS
ncbi:response regulator transcription factor [Oceanobacillus saliphilus]|uniref:response regulator transcription factor n=1 Tax=Oceanobacillus saliphilus TaxID=2925834 RepID=UPI00201E2373|nr:LuxR C-terminal-related transcriptional regulator [Oceanobacillus saliphilus]